MAPRVPVVPYLRPAVAVVPHPLWSATERGQGRPLSVGLAPEGGSTISRLKAGWYYHFLGGQHGRREGGITPFTHMVHPPSCRSSGAPRVKVVKSVIGVTPVLQPLRVNVGETLPYRLKGCVPGHLVRSTHVPSLRHCAQCTTGCGRGVVAAPCAVVGVVVSWWWCPRCCVAL